MFSLNKITHSWVLFCNSNETVYHHAMKNKSKERKNTKKAGLSLKLNRICQTSLLLGKYSAFGCFCGVLFSGRTFPLTWGGQFSSGVGEPAGHPGGGLSTWQVGQPSLVHGRPFGHSALVLSNVTQKPEIFNLEHNEWTPLWNSVLFLVFLW